MNDIFIRIKSEQTPNIYIYISFTNDLIHVLKKAFNVITI